MSAETIRTFIEYHINMTRRVWDLNQITGNNLLQMILIRAVRTQPDGAHHENGPALADGIEKSPHSEWRFQIQHYPTRSDGVRLLR